MSDFDEGKIRLVLRFEIETSSYSRGAAGSRISSDSPFQPQRKTGRRIFHRNPCLKIAGRS
jgi:hypothetical protein